MRSFSGMGYFYDPAYCLECDDCGQVSFVDMVGQECPVCVGFDREVKAGASRIDRIINEVDGG